jgi:hypothetical protein
MKQLVALFLSLSLFTTVLGQSGNDNCLNAINIDLAAPADCPSNQPSVWEVDGQNVGATPSSPAIRLSDPSTGSSLNNTIADVWFAFTANSNRMTLTLSSDALETPTMVLFQGGNCDSKWPILLSRQSGNSTKMTAALEPGQEYFLLVGGSDLNAQGDFRLQFEAYNDCSTCGNRRGMIQASPAPENGTYEAGQTVNFCYTPTLWDPGYALEWLHAVELDFGPGWDLTTLQTLAPESCTEDMGSWDYYDSWQSCNTNETFGPGFAFDARQGLLCGSATPMDGDPGNNFGDGPCNGLEAAPIPLEFCWTITVKDDFASEGERHLFLSARPLGDGYSGSWMPFDCEGEITASFLAKAVPEQLLLPTLNIIEKPCPGTCTGMVQFSGGNAQSYQLLDESGSLLYDAAAGSLDDTLTNLCAGLYELQVSGNGNSQSTTLEVPERQLPEGQVGYIAPCSDDGNFRLVGLLSQNNVNANYYWEGPNGFSANISNPEVIAEGDYTLYITVDDCDLPPLNLNVVHRLPKLQSRATDTAVRFEWDASPQDTAYEVTVLTGQTGTFLSDRVFQVEGLAEGEAVSIELRALGTGACPVKTVSGSDTTLNCVLPAISPDSIICAGSTIGLNIGAQANDLISWSPASSLSCSDCLSPLAIPTENTTYEVTVTTPDGCTSTQSLKVWVDNLPTDILPDSSLVFCPGEPFTFCLPDENQYLWVSPIGFIRTGSCLTYPYTTNRVAGEYLIRVQRPDGCRFYETLRLEIAPDCLNGNGTGSAAFEVDASFNSSYLTRLFPNPTSDYFQLDTGTNQSVEQLNLYNTAGQLIQQWQYPPQHSQLSVQDLSAGVYMLQILLENGQQEQQRLIVK